jgi:hypothetical protein
MQYEDLKLLAGIGQIDSEYPLGVGGILDDAPPLECTQPSPKHQGVAGKHICHFPDHHQNNFPF